MDAESYIDILKRAYITEDEYHSLSSKELQALEDGVGWISRKQLFPIGDVVLIRSEFVDHIDYVEGIRFQVRADETVSLMVVEIENEQYRIQLLADKPDDAASIKQFVVSNDLLLHLKTLGAKILGYEIQTRQGYFIDDDQDSGHLPIQMSRLIGSQYFDGELLPRREPWPLCENTAIFVFYRHYYYQDLNSGHPFVETWPARLLADVMSNPIRPVPLKRQSSSIAVLLRRYLGTHRFLELDGSTFITIHKTSREIVNVIDEYEL